MRSEFEARISRVRMKGGADVSILHTPRTYGDPSEPGNLAGKLIEHAKELADLGEPGSQLDGFIVVGVYSDGTSSTGVTLPSRLPRAIVPAYVAEILRRDVITRHEAERVFDSRFEWVEG